MFIAMQIYILASGFTILNMLIGVLCEVVSTVAKEENEKTMVLDTQHRLADVFKATDTDGSGKISFNEFEKMSESSVVLDAFEAIGVEPKHFGALASVLFDDEENPGEYKSLRFEDFVKLVVKLRPERNASVMDVAEQVGAVEFTPKAAFVSNKVGEEQLRTQIATATKSRLYSFDVGALEDHVERLKIASCGSGGG